MTGAEGRISQAGEQRSTRIESLRALACLCILTFHAFLAGGNFSPTLDQGLFHKALFTLQYSVFIFFALSGYLLFRPLARWIIGDHETIDFGLYARNRILRVLPLYFIAMAVILVLQEHGGSRTQWWHFMLLWENFSAAPDIQYVNPPVWTVIVEIQFYVLLPLLAVVLRRICGGSIARVAMAVAALGLASLALRLVTITYSDLPDIRWRQSGATTFFVFACGMMVALLSLRWDAISSRFRGVLGHSDTWVLATLPIWVLAGWKGSLEPLTAVGGALLVAAVALPLRPGLFARFMDWRAMGAVGVASYSIYMWHVPIVARLTKFDWVTSSTLGFQLIAWPVCIGVGLLSYRLIEEPFLRLRRRWSDSGVEAGSPSRIATMAQSNPLVFATVLFVGIAFVARIAVALATRHTPLPPLQNDPAVYYATAQSLAHGHGYPSGAAVPSIEFPPLYSYFLAVVFKVGGWFSVGPLVAAKLAQAFVGTAVVALVGHIAYRTAGKRVALVAVAITAVFPPLLLIDATLLTEVLYVPLLLATVSAAIEYRRGAHRWRWAIATGLLAGLSILARTNGALVLLPLAIALVSGPWRSVSAWKVPVVMVAVAVLTIAPWTIRNSTHYHRFIPVAAQSGFALSGVYNHAATVNGKHPGAFTPPQVDPHLTAVLAKQGGKDVPDVEAVLRKESLKFMRKHPSFVVKVGFWNALRMLHIADPGYAKAIAPFSGVSTRFASLGRWTFYPVLLLAILGVFTMAARRVDKYVWFVPIVLCSVVFVGGFIRYRAPVDPFLILLSAMALCSLWDRVRRPPTAAT